MSSIVKATIRHISNWFLLILYAKNNINIFILLAELGVHLYVLSIKYCVTSALSSNFKDSSIPKILIVFF